MFIPGVAAVGVGAAEDVPPELLGDGAGPGVLALALGDGAFGAVPQEEQPALLLGYIFLLLLQLLPLLGCQMRKCRLLLPIPHVPVHGICTNTISSATSRSHHGLSTWACPMCPFMASAQIPSQCCQGLEVVSPLSNHLLLPISHVPIHGICTHAILLFPLRKNMLPLPNVHLIGCQMCEGCLLLPICHEPIGIRTNAVSVS